MTLGSPPSPPPIGFMPLIRPGDFIFTAMVLQHRMIKGTTGLEAIAAIRGSVAGSSRSIFGHDIDQIATRVFGSKAFAANLLAANTLFGVYSRGMSQETAKAWKQQLLSGNPNGAPRNLGVSRRNWFQFSFHRLRSCSACIEFDFVSQGFPAWRVLHQVGSLDRCPKHGLPLAEEGAPTGGAHRRLWALRLPGENIQPTSLKQHAYIPVSDGYARYLNLWLQVFSGEVSSLRPTAWIALVNSILTLCGGQNAARKALEEEIQQSWGLPLQEIASRLSLTGESSFAAEELLLNTRPKDIARRIIVYVAATTLGLVRDEHQLFIQNELTLRHSSPLGSCIESSVSSDVFERLYNLVTNRGLPLAMSKLLLADITSSQVAATLRISKEAVRRFVASVPIDLFHNLEKISNWSNGSWLKMELSRRQSRSDHDARPPNLITRTNRP